METGMTNSLIAQEETPHNLIDLTSLPTATSVSAATAAVAAASANSSLLHHSSMPDEIHKQLVEVRERFQEQAMHKMKQIVSTDPACDPLLSLEAGVGDKCGVGGESGDSGVAAVLMNVVLMALFAMKQQVNIMKSWSKQFDLNKSESFTRLDYSSADLEVQEGEDGEPPRDFKQELSDARARILQLTEQRDALLRQNSQASAATEWGQDKEGTMSEQQTTLKSSDQRSQALDGPSDESSHSHSLAQNTQGYVRVEKQQTQSGEVKLKTEETNSREVELERKIAKLKNVQSELVEANQQWEKYCAEYKTRFQERMRQKEEEHERSARKLEKEIEAKEAQLRELSELRNEKDELSKEKAELEQSVIQLKQQLEAAAAAAAQPSRPGDEDFTVLQPENQPSNADVRALAARVQELEREMTTLKKHSPRTKRSNPQYQQLARHSSDSSRDRELQVQEQVAVLRAQVTAFKEDFDMERKEKERLESINNTLRTRNNALEQKVDELQRLCEQRARENNAVREQNQFVRCEYTKKARELEKERTLVAELHSEISRLREVAQLAQATRPNTCGLDICISRPPVNNSWTCKACTYQNVEPRQTCEMCGRKAPHVLSSELSHDPPRLLARQVEQSDPSPPPTYRPGKSKPKRTHWYGHDVEVDMISVPYLINEE